MQLRTTARVAIFGAALVLVAGVTTLPAAGASSSHGHHSGHSQKATYVSPDGSATNPGRSCRSAAFTTISAAVAAAPAGGTVVVCPGTYAEDVVVNKSLDLRGRDAMIDATGLENAIQVVASDVRVSGFTLENANGEGLLAGVDVMTDAGLLPSDGPVLHGIVVEHNRVVNNNKGFNGTENGNCKYPGDCGAGIHFSVTSHSVVNANVETGNSDGILLTDDYGPASHNVIAHNIVNDNTHECGIVLPSHSSNAVTFDPTTFAITGRNPSQGGVFDNYVIGNVTDGNGTDKAPPEFGGGGTGSGIGLFGSGPGSAVYDNVVAGNEATGNGLAGLAVHAHHPGGEDINGNVIVFNRFGTNNLGGDGFDGPPTTDFQTTGIAIFSVPTANFVIAANRIHDNKIGIWLSTTITAKGLGSNSFHNVTTNVVTG